MDNNIDNSGSFKNYFGVRHYNVKVVKEKIKPLRFIASVLSYALFIWLLLIGITLIIYIVNNKIRSTKDPSYVPSYNAYVVLTGSMVPEIMPKDIVVTKKRDASQYEIGDIITFVSSDTRLSNIIVTHRIVNKYYDETTDKYSFQTRGDANNTEDFALAPDSNVIGEVIFKVPKLGYVQDLLATKGIIIIVILIPCLAILSYDIVKLAKRIGKKKSKKITVVRR